MKEKYCKRRQIYLIVCLLGVQSLMAQDKVALVIGNSDYQYLTTLKNPVNDATAMSQTLKELGFDVSLHTDLSKEATKEAIKNFGTQMRTSDVTLFYYAGHGVEILGKNYLVPVNASANSISDIKRNCIPTASVLSLMKLAKSETNIVILDACRESPFAVSINDQLNDGLAVMDAPKGTIISFATSPGKVAEDGEGNHGLFTQSVLDNIVLFDVEIKEMFERVRKTVAEESQEKQIPWESTSLTKPLTLRPSPESDLRVSIAEGDSILFEKEGVLHAKANLDGVSFIWYYEGHQISNRTSVTINKTGRYQVKGISQQGQILLSESIHVDIKSFVQLQVYIAEGDYIQVEKNDYIHAKSNISGTFTWFRNKKKIGEGPELKIDADGLYHVSFVAPDGRSMNTISSKVVLVNN